MKFLLFTIALFAVLATCLTAVARANYSNPDNPGKCTLNSNLILSPGQSIKDPNQICSGITCNQNGDVTFLTCPPAETRPDIITGDYVDASRDYPACCQRIYVAIDKFVS